jgi:hypothetical protein
MTYASSAAAGRKQDCFAQSLVLREGHSRMKRFLIAVMLVFAQCAWAQSENWDEFVDRSAEYLERIQQRLELNDGVTGADRWELDQNAGILTFSVNGEPSVTANFQFVGSVSNRTATWLWSWANTSVKRRVSGRLDVVKAYGEAHGYERLVEPTWTTEEFDGWRMTAVSAYILKADAAYRAAFAGGLSYLLLFDVKNAADEP